jgi:hypothetical protein
MMGITIPLVRDGLITPLELNRMAGLGMNPLDIVGVAVLMTAGSRVRSGILPALEGAAVGIMIRSALHFLIF